MSKVSKEKFKAMAQEAATNIHYQNDFPEDNAIVWAFNKINRKCVYVRESKQETFTPECCIEGGDSINDVHPSDIEGEYCQFCGGKIKKKTGADHADKYFNQP